MKYRIKAKIYNNTDSITFYYRHIVQVKVLFFWVTVKQFKDTERYLSEELLNLLNERL